MKEFVQHGFMDEEPETDLVSLTLLKTLLEVAENCTAGGPESWSKKHCEKHWRKGSQNRAESFLPG
jgi:hypothetical protein